MQSVYIFRLAAFSGKVWPLFLINIYKDKSKEQKSTHLGRRQSSLCHGLCIYGQHMQWCHPTWHALWACQCGSSACHLVTQGVASVEGRHSHCDAALLHSVRFASLQRGVKHYDPFNTLRRGIERST